jgi:hypothetical protein
VLKLLWANINFDIPPKIAYYEFLLTIYILILLLYVVRGHAEWLRHYATSRRVAGTRPDEVNELFQSI